GHAKPDPAYFAHIAEDLGLSLDELLFVDDSPSHVVAARQLGLHAEEWHHERDAGTLAALLRRYGVLPGR
ncbi:MAG: HAD-IA family hydrolase, partial [Marmoricola sp.]